MVRDLPGRTAAARCTLVLAMLVLVAGCATNFRTMRKPAPGATAPVTATTVITTTTVQPVINTASPTLFVLTSPAFQAGEAIPPAYTCVGAGTSPALSWSNVPPHTVELVLAISDPQANSALQWMVAGINPATTGVAAGATPAGGVVLANRAGAHGFAPFCPAAGQNDTYEFTIYALSTPSGLTAGSNADTALAKVSADATGTQAVLTGDYQHP